MPRITVDTAEQVEAPAAQPEKSEEVVVGPEQKQEMPPQLSVSVPPPVVGLGLLQGASSSWLSAYVVNPVGVLFGEAEPGEQVNLLLRAHLATNLVWVTVAAVLLILPVIILPFISSVGLSGVSAGTGFVVVAFWYLGTFTYAFLNFLYWYFNVYLVTNERIIDTDWYSVVVRKVSSTPIAKIQDVSASQVGVFSGIFNYGDVQVQTAGEEENFEFTSVPNPQEVAKQINELIQMEEKEGKNAV